MIVVSSQSRKKLRQALLKHRQGFALSEADYVKQVLKVALNTYKKCIAAPDGTELTLKRHTLINMLRIAKIDPSSVGIDVVVPGTVEQYGNYDPNDFSDLVGHYFLYRRSFQTGRNIVRGVVEIRIDAEKRCLGFEEYNNYLSDGGMPDDNNYTGEIYINPERNLFGLLAFPDGQLRLMMTQGPVRSGIGPAGSLPRGGIRLRGALLTHGKGKGVWQPTISSIALESLPERSWKQARAQCRTIKPEDAEFTAINLELAYAEDYGTVMTPLMWARTPAPQPVGEPASSTRPAQAR